MDCELTDVKRYPPDHSQKPARVNDGGKQEKVVRLD